VRRASRRDAAEPNIVSALEAAGFQVWRLVQPCDLLCWRADKGWRMLECKTPTKTGKQRKRGDQMDQAQFLALTGTPVVKTSTEALAALGAIIWPL
jgi:hypothetical protein